MEKGKTTYTASVKFNGQTYTDTKTADGDAGPHSYTYSVSGNTVTETCSNCSNHTATATLTATNSNYTGSPITTGASVTYSDSWAGSKEHGEITYSNNTNAGTATVKTTVVGNELTTTFQISAKALTSNMVTLSSASTNYTGTAVTQPTVTVADGTAMTANDYTVTWPDDADWTNAGTITVTVTGQNNYTGTVTKNFVIGKGTPTAAQFKFTAPQNRVYTPGTTFAATVTPNASGLGTITAIKYNDSETAPTNAGTYTVTVDVTAGDNYNAATGIEVGNFTIALADSTASVSITGWTYGDKANAPVPESDTNGTDNVTYLYKKQGAADSTYTRTVPTAAGNYTVKATFPATNNYKEATATADFAIAKQEVAAPDIQSEVFCGSQWQADVSENKYYTVTENDGGTDVGIYDVVLTLKDPANYKWTDSENAAKTLGFEITKATNQWVVTRSPVDTTWVYGSPNLPEAGAFWGQTKMEYRLADAENGNDAYTETVPENVGSYLIRFSVADTSNYTGLVAVKELEITKAPLTITANSPSINYGDSAPDYTVTYSGFVNGDDKGDLGGTLKIDCDYAQFDDKGNYTITPSGLTSSNYDITFKPGTLTVKPKPINVTIADKTSVYGEEIVELTATDNGGIVNGDTNVYTLDTTATKTSDVYTYPITGTRLDNNYDITFVNGTYTITKANAAFTAPTAKDLTYNNENQTLIAAGSTDDGTMVYSLEKAGTYTTELPKAKTAGTYHVWYKVIGDGNHKDSDPASVKVEIDKADPGIGTVTAGVVNDTLETSAIVLTRASTTVPGALTVDAEQTLALGDNTIHYTFTPTDGTNYKVVTGEVTVTVKDTIAPTGTVTISTNSWNQFLNDITFGLFFKETQTVSVTASDNLSGVAKIEYIESKTAMDLDTVKAAQQWTEMKNGSVSVTLEDTKQFIYYIRITDKSGNIAYLSSDGAEYDTTAPVIEGVNNGATYYTTQTVTITDKNINTITLNGENATDTITLEGNKEATYTIKATDKAGNSTTVTVTMAPISDITGSMEGKNDANVTSDDKANLQTIVDTATELLQDEDITAEEKAELEDAKADAEALLDAIDKAAKAADTENTAKVEDVTADNVTPEDKSDLEDAKADLEKALEDNSGNYTEKEKKAIEDEIDRIDEALEVIENVEAVEDAIADLPATVEPDDEETVAKIEDAKKAYDELTEYEKSLVDEDTKKKLDDLTAAAVAYKIVKGDGSKWTKGGTSGPSFTANGPLGKFSGVEIDGKVIDAKYYDAVAGSTVITLKASYLETLSTGKHTITVVYTDGEAEGTFKINAKSVTPATGDDSDIMLWTTLLFISVLAIAVLVIGRKRFAYKPKYTK